MSETLTRDDLLDGSAGDLAKAVAAREVSALELTDAAIARIEVRDTAINAVVVRDFDRARDAARAADAAVSRGEAGPLVGVPMTLKESHDVAGLPSTWGADMFKGHVARADGVVAARLKAAGAIILGKTNVPPMLSDWQSTNPIYGRTVNPWDPTRTPGGSSGGSAAALAAGMAALEFGSDIGGSIRVPAAFCGVYGHKPSFNLIPSRGHAPAGMVGAPPPLAVVGPLARTAADLRLALDVTAGPDQADAAAYRLDLPAPRHARLADHRVLMLTDLPGVTLQSDIKAALDDLAVKLEGLGAKVVRSSDLLPDFARSREVFGGLLNTALSRREGATTTVTAFDWLDMLDAQFALRRQWGVLFGSVDVVLSPVFGSVAFPHNDEEPGKRVNVIDGKDTPYFDQLGWPSLALVANLPATAAPIGFTRGGLPIGAQIIGPYLEDRTTIAFAGLLEREFGGFKPPPPL